MHNVSLMILLALSQCSFSRKHSSVANYSVPPSLEPSDKLEARVRILFVVGTEGTGHHFLWELTRHSPFRRVSKVPGVKDAVRKTLLGLWNQKEKTGFWNFHCKWKTSDPKDLGSSSVFAKHLIRLKEVVFNSPLKGEVVVPLNIATLPSNESNFLSFPNFKSACRPLQFPDLDALYYACDEAKVLCSHLVIYRNPFAVIKSTTINRQIEGLARQLKLMSSMSAIIQAQILNQRRRQWWCWEYGKRGGAEHIAAALGWNATAKQEAVKEYDDFWTAFNHIFRPAAPIAASEQDRIVPRKWQAHMQSFLSTTRRIRRICEEHHASVTPF